MKTIRMIVTNRLSALVVRTTTGHSFVFRPGKATMIPQKYVAVCMEHGAGFVNPQDEPSLPGNIPGKRTTKSAAEVEEQMTELFARMAADPTAYRSHFTARGRPHVKWTATQIGQEVSSDLVDSIWNQVLAESGATSG